MAVIKNRGDKRYSKFSTNADVPAVSQPRLITTPALFAYSGAADIDNNNPEVIYLHVFGSAPNQVLLYLWGDLFNQNFYTEMGQHQHGSGSMVNGASNQSFSHNHSQTIDFGAHNHGDHNSATTAGWVFGAGGSGGGSATMPNATNNHALESDGTATGTGDHVHSLGVDSSDGGQKLDIDGGTLAYRTTFPTTGNDLMLGHQTDIHLTPVRLNGSFTTASQANNTSAQVMASHVHSISGNTTNVGLAPGVGSLHTTGTPKKYFTALKIAVDGVDRTAALLAQAGIAAFGDGTNTHTIVINGVQLDLTSWISTPGQHKVVLSLNTLSPNNGGKVRHLTYLM